MLQFDRRSLDNVRVLRCDVGESKRREDSVIVTYRERENISSIEPQRQPNLIKKKIGTNEEIFTHS